MQQILFIAVGGSLGAVARYGLSTLVYHSTGETFPWGTLVVNLTGSFVIGVVIELFDTAIIPTEWRSFITIGFLGAYTTFSTYTLETVNLLRDGELKLATFNIVASNLMGILFVVLGIYSFRFLLKLFS
ncbi:MAG TPA: fluoride efflux transporter CrcB [Bacteroidota bacterium]|nr:fluoride efflux transporter CrcB [Bacteroidota bacterium]